MFEDILWFLLGGLLLFAALLVVAYFVVRFVFVRIAERISAQIALQLEVAATSAIATPAGQRIRTLATARGLGTPEARAAFLKRLDRTARLMDRAIPLPLVGGIGLDALLGLIPYVGDAASTAVTGSIILRSLQYGLPRALVAQMVANMFIDALFGAVPIIGDLFDITFKANTRNMALLRAHLASVEAGTVPARDRPSL
jgi:hypothetical protein